VANLGSLFLIQDLHDRPRFAAFEILQASLAGSVTNFVAANRTGCNIVTLDEEAKEETMS
jgi:hypothetical protein